MPDVYEICKGDTFYRVLEMKSGSSQKGREFMFRNVNWYMQFERRSDMFWLFLMCSKESGNNEPFTVETTIKPRSITLDINEEKTFSNTNPVCPIFSVNSTEIPILLVNGNLFIELEIRVSNSTGIKKDLMSFQKSSFNNTLITCQDLPVFVNKSLLCSSSPGFNQHFTTGESFKNIINDFDMCCFQNYLEMIYGHNQLNDDIVTGVIEVAFAVNTPLILDECETFLINDSKLSIRRKEKIAYRFNLNKLEKHLADIRNPDNLNGPTIPMENDRVPAVQQQENGDEPTETIEID